MFSFRIFSVALLLAASLISDHAQSQDHTATPHGVVPLNKIPSEQWVEKVQGDVDTPGAPFVIRIHNDAGYVVLPHTHPMDENITVVQGSWSVGMGRRFRRSALQPMELGAYGLVPKTWRTSGGQKQKASYRCTESDRFGSLLVDPAYELTGKGVFLLTSLLQPGRPTSSSPLDCFALKIGTQVHADAGEGTVAGARCSPANQLTQYRVRKPNGERFWATLQELKPL